MFPGFSTKIPDDWEEKFIYPFWRFSLEQKSIINPWKGIFISTIKGMHILSDYLDLIFTLCKKQ